MLCVFVCNVSCGGALQRHAVSRFDWISNEKGQAMLAELDGLIVQRRLHKAWVGKATTDNKAHNTPEATSMVFMIEV